MATLTADVTAAAKSWNVSALPVGDYLQVDDEIVHVLDKQRTTSRIRVERGYAGTTAATHSSGATLTPLYIPSVPVGGVQQVRLLGPYEFNYNTPGIDSGLYLTGVFEFTAGMILLDLWVEIVTAWDPGGTPNTTLYVEAEDGVDIFDYPGVPIDSGSSITDDESAEGKVLAANLSTTPAPFLSARTYGEHTSGFARLLPSRIFENAPLYVAVDQNGATALEGQARIYALIAEPA